jgi:hypothetical protein
MAEHGMAADREKVGARGAAAAGGGAAERRATARGMSN